MLSRSLNQVHPWGNWKTIKGYVVLSLLCWELITVTPHSATQLWFKDSPVGVDIVQTWIGLGPIILLYRGETVIYLNRTVHSQAPNNNQGSISHLPSRWWFLNRWWGQLCAFTVTSDPYSRLTINTKAQCQQSIITPPSCESANFLLLPSVSVLHVGACIPTNTCTCSPVDCFRCTAFIVRFCYLTLHLSLWWGRDE